MMQKLQGAAALNVAFVGVSNGLFDVLSGLRSATAAELAAKAGRDLGYVTRWCDAAYAFEYLEREQDRFHLTATGEAFRPDAPDTLMPMAVQAVLGAHMAERAAGLMRTGERPGEKVLAERETILPWFGPMLEHSFATMFAQQIVPAIPAFARVDERGGLAVDLGCGNGWYLRALAKRCGHLRGIGLDGFEENIRQATELAAQAGLQDHLEFRAGDLHHFTVDGPVDLIAMNRALHHVWDEKENVFRILAEHLAPGGSAVIWEPRWPDDPAALRHPRGRGMAFQNLSEHVQGNHFLRPDEIAAELEKAGLRSEVHLFGEGYEAVVVGTKPE
ncbi:MAG: class I SAM-dependent methyltransferase [Deltaproteobacteria bacterium]|nr:class I SAM-dependent methyltransferase [Deltaproteobacteria bacterium]